MTGAPDDLQRRRFLRDSARWALATATLVALPAAAMPAARDERLPIVRVRGEPARPA